MEEKKILENEDLKAANGGEGRGIFFTQDWVSLPGVIPVESGSGTYKTVGEKIVAEPKTLPADTVLAGNKIDQTFIG